MKITIEKEKFRSMLERSLVAGGSKPLLENVVAEFHNGGILFRDKSKDVVQIWHYYKDSYFESLEHNDGEMVPLTDNLLKNIKEAFEKDKTLTVETISKPQEKILISGQKETFQDNIVEANKPEWKIEIEPSKKYGYMAKFTKTVPKVMISIDVEEFKSIPHVDTFILQSANEKLILMTESTGLYKKDLTVSEVEKMEPIRVLVDYEFFFTLLKAFEGKFWLVLEDNYIILSQEGNGYHLLDILSPKIDKPIGKPSKS